MSSTVERKCDGCQAPLGSEAGFALQVTRARRARLVDLCDACAAVRTVESLTGEQLALPVASTPALPFSRVQVSAAPPVGVVINRQEGPVLAPPAPAPSPVVEGVPGVKLSAPVEVSPLRVAPSPPVPPVDVEAAQRDAQAQQPRVTQQPEVQK